MIAFLTILLALAVLLALSYGYCYYDTDKRAREIASLHYWNLNYIRYLSSANVHLLHENVRLQRELQAWKEAYNGEVDSADYWKHGRTEPDEFVP